MAKPNYSFEKHQRDLAKKRKKEEKRQKKMGPPSDHPVEEQSQVAVQEKTDV